MNHDCTITQQLLQRQKDLFRIAANAGHTHKAIAGKTGLSLSAIGQYSRGETAVSGPTIIKLRHCLGPSLVSLLFDDGDYLIEGAGEFDYDTFAQGCISYAAAHAAARHPEGPGGVAIIPAEQTDLDDHAAPLRAVSK